MRNRTYFVKIVVVISMAVILGMTGSTASNYSSEIGKEQTSIALSTFTIENPPVDFEVVDADPFDGFGDNGPYATFNDAQIGRAHV